MEKKLGYFSSIKFLSKYINKYKRNFFMFYFGWFFDMILAIAIPIIFGIMIDEIVYYQNIDVFLRISLVFVIMSTFSCLLYFLIYSQHGYLMSMYVFGIRKDVFRHLQKSDAQYMTDASTGDIISILQRDAEECMHFVIRNVIHMINNIIRVVVITVYLFLISWQIGLFILVAAPVSVMITAKFGKKIRHYGEEQRTQYGIYISWLYEVLTALRDIRMLGARKKADDAFEKNHKKMFAVDIRSGISSITAHNIMNFINLLVQLMIFAFAGFLAFHNNITIGLLTVIVAFFAMLTRTIQMLSGAYLDGQGRIASVQRICNFLQSPTEDVWKGSDELQVKQGNISFEGVSFNYNKSNAVLDNFSLNINAGERFALVGKSGCGKTTLAYMLIGFYRPQQGEIIIDGKKLSDCTLKSIRQNIGLVAQEVLLFDGSIKDNIMLGNKNATVEEVLFACEHSGLQTFIETLPEGIDTIVGKDGIGLSGGQKQRIAIARIYLKNPKIIIFDEATSALDSETEQEIHEAWKSVLTGRTAIIIAHRQSSVMLCERAAILENGHVVEIGNPQDMVRDSDAFKTLFAVKETGKEAKND